MKLSCSVAVGNRILPALATNSKRRHVKSTLALCKNPNFKGFSIVLFSAENKTGTKYEVKNISKVLTRFVNEGKATIQFGLPQHDLYIQAETILLKGFLHLLKIAVENKTADKELMCSSMSVTSKPLKPIVKKLIIEKLSDYPSKGFPRTLEILYINNISRSSVDKGILQLVKLQILDLSHNCLECLPIEIGNLLCLTELNVSHNLLGKSTLKQWVWTSGKISKSLKLLDLRYNELKYLPNSLTKLENLVTLHLDNNELKFLPRGIGTFLYLRTLTASNNLITVIPNSARRLRLQVLDLSENNWSLDGLHRSGTGIVNSLQSFSLKELASRRTLKLQLPFTSETLPQTLIEDLENAEYCTCGSACLSAFIKQLQVLNSRWISDSVSVSPTFGLFVPIESYFCSLKCFASAPYNRRRNRIVR